MGERVLKKDLPWAEPHNHLNAICAGLLAAAASELGSGDKSDRSYKSNRSYKTSKLLEGLGAFRGLSHRMERLGERGGVSIINNSMCTNPSAVISSSRGIPGRQRLLIGGVTKGLEFSPLGTYLSGTPHQVYVFGRDAGAINSQLGGSWPVFKTLEQAFEAAVRDAQPGDSVVLSPGAASLDQFEDFRERGEAFKMLAQEWMNG